MRHDFTHLIGKKSGMLTVIDVVFPEGSKRQKLVCKCDCGNTVLIFPYQFDTNYSQLSCGCIKHRTPYNATHKLSRTKLYHVWETMRLRCSSPEDKKYYCYGARGIAVCDEWYNNFLAFRDWALSHGYQEGLTIDRIDNNQGYSPDNCRWTSRKIQQRNRRNNVYITYQGKTQTLIEWCEELGLKYKTINGRIQSGWDKVRAITEPIHTPKNKN